MKSEYTKASHLRELQIGSAFLFCMIRDFSPTELFENDMDEDLRRSVQRKLRRERNNFDIYDISPEPKRRSSAPDYL